MKHTVTDNELVALETASDNMRTIIFAWSEALAEVDAILEPLEHLMQVRVARRIVQTMIGRK